MRRRVPVGEARPQALLDTVTFWLGRRRPELVFGLLIALVLPEDGGSSILIVDRLGAQSAI